MNKVLIIGGTSGIGRGLVDVYLKNSYVVGVVGRTKGWIKNHEILRL